ncbi:MAG: endonuclease NucS [Micropruina sp.]
MHADDRAYKPLNWMNSPCTLTVTSPEDSTSPIWEIVNKDDDTLVISIAEVLHDSSHELGVDPGLVKDGVEAHLQVLLAEHPETFGAGWTLAQRGSIDPDRTCRPAVPGRTRRLRRRRGEAPREIDGVEQPTRYLALMNADSLLAPVRGVFAAQLIKPQAKTLAGTRGIACVSVDYNLLRGLDNAEDRLF